MYEYIVDSIVDEIKNKMSVMVEASGRHIHLSQDDADTLFGKGYKFTVKKELSQPGQYAYNERVTIKGPKGEIKNVAVLGPCRSKTQIEISLTDARLLGINAPVRLSGDTKDTPGCTVFSDTAKIDVSSGVIVAKRHIHITPCDAEKYRIKNNDEVKIKVYSKRPVIFENVVARVSDKFKTSFHIDYDEANSCGFSNDCRGIIIQ